MKWAFIEENHGSEQIRGWLIFLLLLLLWIVLGLGFLFLGFCCFGLLFYLFGCVSMSGILFCFKESANFSISGFQNSFL